LAIERAIGGMGGRPPGDNSPPYLVTDIGGGSTEFVLGGADAGQVQGGR